MGQLKLLCGKGQLNLFYELSGSPKEKFGPLTRRQSHPRDSNSLDIVYSPQRSPVALLGEWVKSPANSVSGI